jgi:hypothetical protein
MKTSAELQAILDGYTAEYNAAWSNIVAAVAARGTPNRLTPIRTGFGGALIVHQVSYGHVDVDAVLDGTAAPLEALLTEDGRGADIFTWHTGEQTGESVYVERWTPAGRTFHGYVDPASRQVVQTG